MLIAGGNFSIAGEASVDNIAAWDGEAWIGLGGGLNGTVNALATYRGDLIAGGLFIASGSVSVANIARWDGSTWTTLGSGTDNRVSALVEFAGELIAGGEFTTAGGRPASYLAVWDGAQWTPRGEFQSKVEDLDVFEGNLVAGGLFDEIDGVPTGYLARWDGAGWSSLGGGVDGRVRSIAVHDGDLIAGGLFTSGGSPAVPVNNVAVWDGESWSALGVGVDAEVRTVTFYRTDLIVGGSFLSAGSVPAARIARWNGEQWSSLGGGLDDVVWSLRQQDGRLFVGGRFLHASGISSSRLAAWDDGPIGGVEYRVNAQGDGDFRSVQDAVEAVAVLNDVIRVDSAIFDEDVVIEEKVIDVIATTPGLRPTIRSLSWQNDFDTEPDAGGRLEGLRIVDDLTAERLSESTSLINCTVGNSIDVKIIPTENIRVEAGQCTVAISIVLQGVDGQHGSTAAVDHCVMTGSDASISVFGRNAQITNTSLLGRGDIWVHGEDTATAANCLVSEGSITVHGLRTAATATSCLILSGSLDVQSWERARADENVITGSIYVLSAVAAIVTGNLVQGGDIKGLADGWADISSNVVIGSPGEGLVAVQRGDIVGNTVVGCDGAGIRYESPGIDSNVSRNLCVGNTVGIALINPNHPFIPDCNNSWGNGTDWIGIFDPTGSDGNISEDPRFCDLPAFDLTLASGSVCLPGNHPQGCNSDRIGALDQGCELPASGLDEGSPAPTAKSFGGLTVQPNPARHTVQIALRAEPGSPVAIRILDVTGREVETLFRGLANGPVESFEWTPGPRVESGVYFVVAEDKSAFHKQRIVLVQ